MPTAENNEEYSVGWICAVPTEFVAAIAFLDEEHERPKYVAPNDNNNYKLGRIKGHNVVLAVLPEGEYGTTSAAAVARDMLHSFPSIRIGLMVGIGGGVPSADHDVRLGDVVVSSPRDGHGGVFQYDYGKTVQDQKFRATGRLNQPPTLLRTAISGLKGQYEVDGHQIQEAIRAALEKKPRLRKKYCQPDPTTDRLYYASVVHQPNDQSECLESCGNDASALVSRRHRYELDDIPTIHYGLIASGNQLMKDAIIRDKLAQEEGVLCFEMEAAGLMNHFPCLVIRGICDYSDSHKNKQWQGYAAMTAAAYARDLLNTIPPNKIIAERKILDSIDKMHTVVSKIQGQTIETKTRVEAMQADGQLDKVRKWLAPPDPSLNFNKARSEHYNGTGKWLLDSEVFRNWKTEPRSFLWLNGIPGCGKTILSSSVIADLEMSADYAQNLLTFYFDFSDVAKQSLDGAIRSLIAQLYCKRKDVRQVVDALYSAFDKGGRQPDQNSLLTLFQTMIQQQDYEFWLVLDALDECHTRSDSLVPGLLSWIEDVQAHNANVHILVTSRPEHDIKAAFEKWVPSSAMISLQSTRVEDDINAYIQARTREMHRWQNRPEVWAEIEAALSSKADGMFRWVSCQFDVLNECLDLRSVRAELVSLPQTLDATYERILQNIKPQHEELAIRLLQFLTYSERPLRVEEAVDIIALESSSQSRPRFDPANRMPIPQEVVRYCFGLAILREREDEDQETISVEIRLAHFSVQEYLTSDRLKSGMAQRIRRPIASVAIARICLSYLLDIDHSYQPWEATKKYPLARFAAQYWAFHAGVVEQSAENLQSIIEEYVTSSKAFDLGYQLHQPDQPWNGVDNEFSLSVGVLYYVSVCGLSDTANGLLLRGADVNAEGGFYGYALQAASAQGHEDMVRLLLEKGADVNAEGGCYGYALQAASLNGHEEIVQLLLEKGADVNAEGGRYGYALQAASAVGHEDIVRLLLEKGADVNAEGGKYGYALQVASAVGHEDIVRLLLEKGTDINARSGHYGYALQAASAVGQEEIVRLLLEKGADVNAIGGYYGHALHAAAAVGHEEIVRLLLEKGADINVQGGFWGNNTALQVALTIGHEGIVQILQGWKTDTSNQPDDCVTPVKINVGEHRNVMAEDRQHLDSHKRKFGIDRDSAPQLVDAVPMKKQRI